VTDFLDFDQLRLIWWWILALYLISFAILDGADLGTGTIFCLIAQTDDERRALLISTGPVHSRKQVWLIAGGLILFAAWPRFYTASCGLIMLILVMAIWLRPIGLHYRNRVPSVRWRKLWDWTWSAAAASSVVTFGVALGNLFLGVPFHFDESHRFVYTGGLGELLHPYALLTGLISLSMVVMHASAYAALRAGEPLSERACKLAQTAATTFMLAFLIAGVWSSVVMDGYVIEGAFNKLGAHPVGYRHIVATRGGWLENFHCHPLLWVSPAGALLLALVTRKLLVMREPFAALISSMLAQSATILTAAFALFPFILPSSEVPGDGLTIWNASSSEGTLRLLLVSMALLVPIAVAFMTGCFGLHRGRPQNINTKATPRAAPTALPP
jgi:cytochrome bd ubiquinol oxidase subunit II